MDRCPDQTRSLLGSDHDPRCEDVLEYVHRGKPMLPIVSVSIDALLYRGDRVVQQCHPSPAVPSAETYASLALVPHLHRYPIAAVIDWTEVPL